MNQGFGSTPDARGRGGKQNSGGKDAPTSAAPHKWKFVFGREPCKCAACRAARSLFFSKAATLERRAARMHKQKPQDTPKQARQAFTRTLRPIKARLIDQSTGELVLRAKKALL